MSEPLSHSASEVRGYGSLDESGSEEFGGEHSVDVDRSSVQHLWSTYWRGDYGQSQVQRDNEVIRQAMVFFEDAVEFRSIHHKIDRLPLLVYQYYYSRPVQWFLKAVIAVDLLLAFFERPSSLSWSSDPKLKEQSSYELPCGIIEGVEFFCLAVFSADLLIKAYWLGMQYFFKRKWQLCYAIAIMLSLLDWILTVSFRCNMPLYLSRWRRTMRPIFFLQRSSLMKKVLHCVMKTLPEIASVLLLLFFHVYFFTMFGMLLFPPSSRPSDAAAAGNRSVNTTFKNESVLSAGQAEGDKYFSSLDQAFISLLVLLTTANNPDVMMPAYRGNRLYALFFMVYVAIGTFCLLNLLTAVIFKQFRGYFQSSVYSSFRRRCVAIRAGFEVLRGHPSCSELSMGEAVATQLVRKVLYRADFGSQNFYKPLMHECLEKNASGAMTLSDLKQMFSVLLIAKDDLKKPTFVRLHSNRVRRFVQWLVNHPNFRRFQSFAVILNAFILTLFLAIWYDSSLYVRNNHLEVTNFFFTLYYFVELILICFGLGWQQLRNEKGIIFTSLVSVALVIVEIVHMTVYGSIFQAKPVLKRTKALPLIDFIRIINILILLKLFHLLIAIKSLREIFATLLNLLKNFWPFAGILMAAFYIFASIGMAVFGERSAFDDALNHTARTDKCGTYEQLGYYPNNFNDFAGALVVLWDVMVVNNWGVFLSGFSYAVDKWTQIYFIAWWLVSAVLGMNLFIAIILEAFVTRWDKFYEKATPQYEDIEQLRTPPGTPVSANEHDPLIRSVPDRRVEDSQGSQRQGVISSATVLEIFKAGGVEPSEADVLHELHQHHFLVIN